jgi:hypothetical protein
MKNQKQKLTMIKTIKNLLKTVSNLITLFNNLLKKIFSLMVQKCKIFYIISVHFKNRLFSKNINSQIMTLLSLLYLGALLIYFLWLFEYKLIDMFQIFILSLFSFAVFIFISDNYKFSNNKFIFLLQKIVSYSLIFALIILIGTLLYLVGVNISIFGSIFCDSDVEEAVETYKNNEKISKGKDVARITESTKNETYTLEVNKKVVERAIEKGPELVVVGIKEVAPKLELAAAAGETAEETIKQTKGMTGFHKLLANGGAAFVTAVGTSLGLSLGTAATENKKGAEIEASKAKSVEISNDESESPTEFNRSFIHSVLEDNEIPLIVMVNGLSYLNYIELSLVISIFSLLFRKFLIRKLTDIIIKLIQKIKKTNKQIIVKEVESIKDKDIDKNVSLNKAINNLDKYTDFIIVFIFICLF